MVKNTVGGSKHKSFARKQQTTVNEPPVIHYIRRANDGELYASASKNYGGGRFEVICSDGKNRICIIRRKFKGRYRRGNDVAVGTYMLIGKREWETADDTCDLLCTYSSHEVNILKQDAAFKYDVLCVNEKKMEDVDKSKRAPSMSGREKAAAAGPRRYVEDIVFDEDVHEEDENDDEENEEDEVEEQKRFAWVKKNDNYNINDYLDGIDDEECSDEECDGERDELGNYIN
jgi:initiation factor 1A